MTLLEFCKSFFPCEKIFLEQDGMLTVKIRELKKLEKMWKKEDINLRYDLTMPTDILDIVWEYDPNPIGSYCPPWQGPEQFTLSEEGTRMMKRFRLVIDPEVSGMDDFARRPYFRMRGRPVTEEQAFEIIRRTDCGWKPWGIKYEKLKDEIWCSDILRNHWFNDATYPQGWVRPSGQIGANGCSGEKYPGQRTFLFSILPLMLTFPYLDLMIGITDWNEAPPYAYEALAEMDDVFEREDYPDFEEHIVYGVWLHDGTLELMSPARAREKYAQYNTLYAGPDEEIYKIFYYLWENDRQIPVDLAYLKRCIRSHGLDPEEVLASREWGPKGLRDLRLAEWEAAAPGSGT